MHAIVSGWIRRNTTTISTYMQPYQFNLIFIWDMPFCTPVALLAPLLFTYKFLLPLFNLASTHSSRASNHYAKLQLHFIQMLLRLAYLQLHLTTVSHQPAHPSHGLTYPTWRQLNCIRCFILHQKLWMLQTYMFLIFILQPKIPTSLVILRHGPPKSPKCNPQIKKQTLSNSTNL